MTKVESKGFYAGEKGTILFRPNDKAPDSKSIRLSQAARTFDVDTKAPFDWAKSDPHDIRKHVNYNKMLTTAATRRILPPKARP